MTDYDEDVKGVNMIDIQRDRVALSRQVAFIKTMHYAPGQGSILMCLIDQVGYIIK